MKVMIVDDSPRIRKALRRLINKDTEFAECSNGFEAVKTYPQFLPDWTLMDIEMPEMNGLEASSKIIINYPNAKIIIVTQYDEKELREKAIEIGAIGYITKDNLDQINNFIPKILFQIKGCNIFRHERSIKTVEWNLFLLNSHRW